jgi:hypothetical protein
LIFSLLYSAAKATILDVPITGAVMTSTTKAHKKAKYNSKP